MLLKTGESVEGTVNPEITGAKRIRRANAERWRNQGVAAPIDISLLSRRYGGDAAYAPRLKQATFKVPLGVSPDAFRKEQGFKVWTWINRMQKMGWDWLSDRKIQVYPGHYPAYETDHEGGIVPILDMREFIARAWFRQRKPEFIRTEVRPELLEPTYAPGALKHLSEQSEPERR